MALFVFIFGENEGGGGGDRDRGIVDQFGEVLVVAEGGQHEDELARAGVVEDGRGRGGLSSARLGGNPAAERRGIRGIVRHDEPAEEALALVRALVGLAGRRELGPVGLVVVCVPGAREQQDVGLALVCDETDRLDRIATIGGLGERLGAMWLERERASREA